MFDIPLLLRRFLLSGEDAHDFGGLDAAQGKRANYEALLSGSSQGVQAKGLVLFIIEPVFPVLKGQLGFVQAVRGPL